MVLTWLAGLCTGIAPAACAGGATTLVVSHQTQVYHDSAGWTIKVPPGWRAAQFSDSTNGVSSAGVQLSNVRLPLPSLLPGYPIQVNSRVLPARGIGLIIASDTDPKLSHGQLAEPPLPSPNGRRWMIGSSLGGTPYMTLLWFRFRGMTFIACAKIGSKVTNTQMDVLIAIIQSLH